MSLSHPALTALIAEIKETVLPARVQKVFEDAPASFVFQLRAPGQTHYLALDARRPFPRLHLTASKPPQPEQPSPWTMLLRKWLHGAWIEELKLAHDDRLITLTLQAIDPSWEPGSDDERAPRVRLQLVAELAPTLPAAFLLDGRGRVLGSTPGPFLGDRELSAGAFYERPAPPPTLSSIDDDPLDLAALPADGARSRALEAHAREQIDAQAHDQLYQALRSRLQSALKRHRRKAKNIEADLDEIENAEEYRRRGELLQSAYGKIERGAPAARVPDYYQEGMPLIEIPLDPARSLQKNIDRYFHQYRRFAAARHQVEERLLGVLDEIATLEALRDELAPDLSLAALQDLDRRLRATGLVRRKQRRARGSGKQSRRLPPHRTFVATSGAHILVGRGSKQNDELTTKVARGRDVWLHARDWAGAHVVLRVEKNQEPRSEDILDAAFLAAHFSRGKEDSLIDVTHTRAKHVRKPPAAPPGLVTVSAGSTLAVRLDDERLQRLLISEIRDDD